MSNVSKFPGVTEITTPTPAEFEERLEEAIKDLREAVASGDAKHIAILTDGTRGPDICWLNFPRLSELVGLLELGKFMAVDGSAP